ncbi:MAG: class I SAM-dependent methyltransferase [Candidatus Thorarchaeota archaeon]|nr:MAG: class I SAM-dependent methyltransferase [Candidatus Thorarchaeota archaeon]
MRDAYEGRDSTHILERDDGYSHDSSGAQYVASFDEWNPHEKLAIARAKGRVLDVGCGAGRVALYLIELGHEVIGIDVSPGALEVCKERGFGSVHLMSAETIDFPDETFDTVVLYGNNFGFLGFPNRVIDMLKQLHRVAKRDGIVLAATRNPLMTEKPEHLALHARNRAQGRPPGLIRIRMKYEGQIGDWFDLLSVTEEEMAELGGKAGWKLSEIIRSDTEQPELYVGLLIKE